MPEYRVGATVTISLSKQIVADDAEDALERARDLRLPDLCFQCARDQDDSSWALGELDGEPSEIKVDA